MRGAAFGAIALVSALIAAPVLAATAPHSYPPSCFADGLPFGQAARDPHAGTLPLTLHGDFNACFVNPAAPNYATAQQECHYSETVAISVFRAPCSGGKSATLLEIDRASGMSGNMDLYPTFPGVWVQQGSHVAYIRLAADPNTSASQAFVNGPVYNSSVYTLENFATGAAFDYNQAFTLTVDNNTGRALQFDLGIYNPADYGAAAAAVPLSGYLSGSWYDPAHSGEGILTQIFDSNDGSTRIFAATWYTYDASGAPYWLVAQGNFPIGATHIDNVIVQYNSAGGFAGNFGTVMRNPWGTMSFAFPDCNTMSFSYASGSGVPGNAPQGSGTRTWRRIGTINNLGCQ